MSLDFILSAPCAVCGHILRGLEARWGCRINKNNIASNGGLIASPFGHGNGRCPECHTDNGFIDRSRRDLEPGSLAKVNRYRVKRGWEPIAA